MWWNPDRYQKKYENLQKRARLIRAVREFFDRQEFDEVQTPALQTAPGMEPHLRAFKTEMISPDGRKKRDMFLHTSPEFAMKKLLVAGCERIYQICHCYRNYEGSRLHSPEFTMIEWYRAHAGYHEIMEDSIGLLRHCAERLGIDAYGFKGSRSDPFAEWEIITVCEAFRKYAGIRLESFLPDKSMTGEAEKLGLHTHAEDSWDDVFFRIFLEKVEPHLGQGRPTILYDYPLSMAALSRPKEEGPRFAERFEIYVCGMELANAFGELTDPKIQRQRFVEDLALKHKLYDEKWPVDEDFIAALEHGMPESGGIALGIDRLAMLATGAEAIEDILWCPV